MVTVANIVNATDTQLICMTYDLFVESIEDALSVEGLERKTKLVRTREILMSLSENLNLEVQIGKDLFRLYVYIQNILLNAWQQDTKLEEAKQLIEMIASGYKTISQEAKTVAVDNAQSIYAGMTYGKGYLNEMIVDTPSRGFKA